MYYVYIFFFYLIMFVADKKCHKKAPVLWKTKALDGHPIPWEFMGRGPKHHGYISLYMAMDWWPYQKKWLYGYIYIYIYVCIYIYVYIYIQHTNTSSYIHNYIYMYIIHGWMCSIHLTYNHGTTADRQPRMGQTHRQPRGPWTSDRTTAPQRGHRQPARWRLWQIDILWLWSM